jgi:hypothetical protein
MVTSQILQEYFWKKIKLQLGPCALPVFLATGGRMTTSEADHLISNEATQFLVAVWCSKSNSAYFFDAEQPGLTTSSKIEESDTASIRVPSFTGRWTQRGAKTTKKV